MDSEWKIFLKSDNAMEEVSIVQLKNPELLMVFNNIRMRIAKTLKAEVHFILAKDQQVANAFISEVSQDFVEAGALQFWADQFAKEIRNRGMDVPGAEFSLINQ